MQPYLDDRYESQGVHGGVHALLRLPSTCAQQPHSPPGWCTHHDSHVFQCRDRSGTPNDHCDRRGRRGRHVRLRRHDHHGLHGLRRPLQQRAQHRCQRSPSGSAVCSRTHTGCVP